MRRVLIIYRVDINDRSNTGVLEKLQGQANGLRAAGYEVDTIYHSENIIYKNQEIYKSTQSIFFDFFKLNFFKHLASLTDYNIYIIRYGLSTPSFFKWLQIIKKANSKAKIIIDLPTYPYHEEWSGRKGRVAMYFDRLFQDKLQPYVDLIIHSGIEKTIFNIPTHYMTNGVSIQQKAPKRILANRIRFIAIGKWRYWHGLDRFISAMAIAKADVYLDVVGEGSELSTLRHLAQALQLEDQITWHGTLTGGRLQKVIDQAHCGVGTLGLFRKGVQYDSSLKHRKYCAQGLPFILAGEDRDFPESLPYVHYVSDQEAAIDMEKVVTFVREIYTSRFQDEMVAYARHQLSWAEKMKSLKAAIEKA